MKWIEKLPKHAVDEAARRSIAKLEAFIAYRQSHPGNSEPSFTSFAALPERPQNGKKRRLAVQTVASLSVSKL